MYAAFASTSTVVDDISLQSSTIKRTNKIEDFQIALVAITSDFEARCSNDKVVDRR